MPAFSPLDYLALFVEATSGGTLAYNPMTYRLTPTGPAGTITFQGSDSQNRIVNWDANVTILSGPNVLLVIDPTGKIVTDEGVTVTDGESGPTLSTTIGDNMVTSGTTVVQNIAPISGQADFYADNGISNDAGDSTSSPYPLFTFDDTFASIKIINESNNDLNIHNITAYDLTENAPTVEINTPGGKITTPGGNSNVLSNSTSPRAGAHSGRHRKH